VLKLRRRINGYLNGYPNGCPNADGSVETFGCRGFGFDGCGEEVDPI